MNAHSYIRPPESNDIVGIRLAEPSDAESIRDTARVSWHAAYDALLGEEVVASTVEEWYDPPNYAR